MSYPGFLIPGSAPTCPGGINKVSSSGAAMDQRPPRRPTFGGPPGPPPIAAPEVAPLADPRFAFQGLSSGASNPRPPVTRPDPAPQFPVMMNPFGMYPHPMTNPMTNFGAAPLLQSVQPPPMPPPGVPPAQMRGHLADLAPRSGRRAEHRRPSTGRASSKRQRRRLSGERRASAQIESALGRAF